MTGAEHYAESERVLAGIAPKDVLNAPVEVGLSLAKAAQVHATLALAAAFEKRTVEFPIDIGELSGREAIR